MFLPGLPEKKMMKSDDVLIRSRMRGLNIFMEKLANNAYLRGDPSLLAFISVADPSAWEAAKVAGETVPVSQGLTVWRNALTKAVVPENSDR
jgi:hypothetical protein